MQTVTEIWRETPRYPNYEASNLGRVRSLDRVIVVKRPSKTYERRQRGGLMTPIADSYGYFVISLSHYGKKKLVKLHRLVADAFHGDANGLVVNHKNGNKHDNRPENLEYVTPGENTLHAYRTGLNPCAGESNGNATLRADQVREIRKLKGYREVDEVSREYGINKTTVYSIWRGTTWKALI